MPAEIYLRFYEELNDYLPPEKRKREFSYPIESTFSVGRLLQAVAVPESEVELVLVNGSSVNLSYCLAAGDRVSVYPVFESLDVRPILQIRNEPLRKPRFLVDPKLRRLALYLRLLGFDAPVNPGILSAEQKGQIILTVNSELLKSGFSRVYVVRAKKPRKQLKEVLSRFHLFPSSLYFLSVRSTL